MDTYPNGVYGINLTKRLEGTDIAGLALLQEITNAFNAYEQDEGDHGVPCIGSEIFSRFHQRLELAFAKKGIGIPTLEESKSRDTFDVSTCRIHRVHDHAEVNEDGGFDPNDLILGVGILGFPNDIKFRPGFFSAAAWHLWVIE